MRIMFTVPKLAGGGADEETIKTVMESVDQAWKAGYKDIAAEGLQPVLNDYIYM